MQGTFEKCDVTQWWEWLRGPYRPKIIFFIICFYAIMHRTTIAQNKIMSIICSCLFFCPANIHRPSLGKVQLGRPNPNLAQSLYLRRKKKTILLRIVCTTMYRHPIFIFIFFLFLKMYRKTWQMFNYI